MAEKIYGGVSVACNDEGYMTDLAQWSKTVAEGIAEQEEIAMTEKHWEVIDYIQNQYRNDVGLTIRRIGKSGVVSIKEFYQLFPNGPLKKASKIAGIPKPASCI